MVQKSSIFWVLKEILTVSMFLTLISCKNQNFNYQTFEKSHKYQAQSVSKSMSDVIREFYIIDDIKFDFIVYGEKSKHIDDIIDEVTLELSQNEIPIIIKHFSNVSYWNHKLKQSAVIFMKSLENLENLHKVSEIFENNKITQIITSVPEKIKFLIYIEEIKTF
ncbi:hypothetical protein PVAND_001094 [Polypedilum vanderplanki]|uniref:Lipoprotein n=1 Tax=Polypedilum vanderplanki TaxID=319348 RepID=A0A9J6BMA1_POLVA|nr:hypothetical protein PVAND_001094 [Polypedilum vanderplanki]